MKRLLLLVSIFILSFSQSFGQNCFGVGIKPNHGTRGQVLTTSISSTQLFSGYGSAPCNPGDVYLYQSATSTTIYASTLNIQQDSVRVTWNFPSNVPSGAYDLSVTRYSYLPMGSCVSGLNTCYQQQVFGIDANMISGSVFYDSNQDSIYNPGDQYLSNKKILLLPENIITLTDASGSYTFFTDTGNHTIIILNDSTFHSITPDTVALHVAAASSNNIDFALYPDHITYDSYVYLYGRARCSTVQTFSLAYYNYSTLPVNMVLKFFHSTNVLFMGSNIQPDSISGDTVYYSISNVSYGSGQINVQLQIPPVGASITYGALLESYDQSGNLVDHDEDHYELIVSCSYDPNEKTVNPPGILNGHLTLFGEPLVYTIHFQNTGNDTAYDVSILDTIDSRLDISSLKIISSSHPVTVHYNSKNILDFSFSHIMLPDSFVDEPRSNGYVAFVIDPKPSLPEMTLIQNSAYIFFDQNPAVITNEAYNTLVSILPVGINDPDEKDKIILYPNPFTETVRIENLNGERISQQISITDLQGRELYNSVITSNNFQIDLHGIAEGIYFYRIYDNLKKQTYLGRLIKQ